MYEEGRREYSRRLFFYFMKLRSIDILLGSAMIKRACHCAHLVRMLLACMFARAFFYFLHQTSSLPIVPIHTDDLAGADGLVWFALVAAASTQTGVVLEAVLKQVALNLDLYHLASGLNIYLFHFSN